MACQKNGGFDDYGKSKQHDYYALGVVLSYVKAWRRRTEKTVGGRGYKRLGSDKILAGPPGFEPGIVGAYTPILYRP